MQGIFLQCYSLGHLYSDIYDFQDNKRQLSWTIMEFNNPLSLNEWLVLSWQPCLICCLSVSGLQYFKLMSDFFAKLSLVKWQYFLFQDTGNGLGKGSEVEHNIPRNIFMAAVKSCYCPRQENIMATEGKQIEHDLISTRFAFDLLIALPFGIK